MKKAKTLIAIIALLAAGASSFAEHESSLNYTIGGGFFTVKDVDYPGTDALSLFGISDVSAEGKLGYGFAPIGLTGSSTWYKKGAEKGKGKFNVGFDLKVGMSVKFGLDADIDDIKVKFADGSSIKMSAKEIKDATDILGTGGIDLDISSDDWIVIGEYFSLGPTFKFWMNEKNAFRLTPGVQLNLDEGFYTGNEKYVSSGKILDIKFALSLDLEYQHYFTDHVGLNLGFAADVPLVGAWSQSFESTVGGKSYTSTTTATVGPGFYYNFLLGVVFR